MAPDADDPRDDATLLADHVAGDPTAFGVLVARHRDRLWAVALRTTGNREDAADALQDALVAAYRRAAGFRGEAAVTTWLHRIVVNACLDRHRAAAVRRADPLPDDLDHARRGPDAVGAPGAADPADAAVAADRRGLVVAALAELPPEQRAALVLVDLEGFSVGEAALVLDCAPGTVKSRCSRGRARLAVLLAPLLAETATPPAAQPAAGSTGAVEGNRDGPRSVPPRPGAPPPAARA